MSILSRPYFHDEAAAFEHVEAVMWPQGTECPHCGTVGTGVKIKANPEKRIRYGLWKCGDCKKQFTVKVGTVFEDSKVPLQKWLQAIYLMTSSKKGVSAHQLHRGLEVTYKTAWFMAHRIREAMREGTLSPAFGRGGSIVEADETFIGNDPTRKKGLNARGGHHKHKVLALIDRRTGRARTMVIEDVNAREIGAILRDNVRREAWLVTDEAGHYTKLGRGFASHDYVNHGKGEYGRGEIHTNTAEGYFSVFKRGMKGVYQHFGKRHLHRYVAEFEFRYNYRSANGVEDAERADLALRGAIGKRLYYTQDA